MPYSTRRRMRHVQPTPHPAWQVANLTRRFRCTPTEARVYLAQNGGDA